MKTLVLALLTLSILASSVTAKPEPQPLECKFYAGEVLGESDRAIACLSMGKFCLTVGVSEICQDDLYCIDFVYGSDYVGLPEPELHSLFPGGTVVMHGPAYARDGGRTGFGMATFAMGLNAGRYCGDDDVVGMVPIAITEVIVGS